MEPKAPEPKAAETEVKKEEPKADPKADAKKDDKTSLLNKKDGKEGAPETYADFKLPEGMQIDKEQMAAATSIFKELNLSQEGGQKLMDLYTKLSGEAAEAPYKAFFDTRKAWVDAVKADPEIGGSNLDTVKITISRAIDGLGDPALAAGFREAMDITGAGDNPFFIKAFYKLAQNAGEGTPVKGGNPTKQSQAKPGSSERPSAAQAMYGHLSKDS